MAEEMLGSYKIVREIGQGGMGKVYEGESPQGERVAIKEMILAPELEPSVRWEVVERFQREARAARSMDHKNIIKCFDVGEQDGRYFMVLELLEGQSVRDIIDTAGAIAVPRTVEIVTDVCAALQYAHEQGIIHRDIKPDNIMLLKGGLVKLMDFGLASIVAEKSQTVDGTVMGTYSYMSPEQARGEKVDLRTDIFSLGATMYEMLSGQLPFPGEGMAAVTAILSQEPPQIGGLPPHVSFALKKCLSKDPKGRFGSARELADALNTQASASVGGATVVARPGAGGTVMQQPRVPGTVIRQAGAPGTVSRQPSVPQQPGGPSQGGTVLQQPGARPAAPPQKHVKKCPKCGEPWQGNAASCWKCGTPDPTLRRKVEDPQREIDAILKSTQKKKGWWPFGKKK